MASNEPTAKNLADLYKLAPLDWDDVRGRLETNLTQEPGTGGPGHHTFWLSTLDADGRPHMTAVGAYWVDGRYYFSGGPRSRKIRNIERDSRCAFGVAIHGYDVALEGRAVRVTDNGVGISPAELKRIFKRFYRIPATVAVRAKGSGLGLFIVRSVAKKHGGKAYAESAGQGQGSTFTLQLPAAPASA